MVHAGGSSADRRDPAGLELQGPAGGRAERLVRQKSAIADLGDRPGLRDWPALRVSDRSDGRRAGQPLLSGDHAARVRHRSDYRIFNTKDGYTRACQTYNLKGDFM